MYKNLEQGIIRMNSRTFTCGMSYMLITYLWVLLGHDVAGQHEDVAGEEVVRDAGVHVSATRPRGQSTCLFTIRFPRFWETRKLSL